MRVQTFRVQVDGTVEDLGVIEAEPMTINVVDGLQCPVCNVGETDPEEPEKLAIRGFKVMMDENRGWESECLHCKQMFGNGWFCSQGEPEYRLEVGRTVSERRCVASDILGHDGPFTADERSEFADLRFEAEQHREEERMLSE